MSRFLAAVALLVLYLNIAIVFRRDANVEAQLEYNSSLLHNVNFQNTKNNLIFASGKINIKKQHLEHEFMCVVYVSEIKV